MSKQIKQFRYYTDTSTSNRRTGIYQLNQPTSLTKAKLMSGSIFADCMPIYALGIQTLPGVKFYLNNSDNPTIVNSTGIYELDLKGEAQINSLTFAGESLSNIDNSQLGYLIIDMICGEES